MAFMLCFQHNVRQTKFNGRAKDVEIRTKSECMGGGVRHSTAVVFTLRTPAAWVQITAPEIFSERKNSLSDAAVLIYSNSALLRAKSEQCKKA